GKLIWRNEPYAENKSVQDGPGHVHYFARAKCRDFPSRWLDIIGGVEEFHRLFRERIPGACPVQPRLTVDRDTRTILLDGKPVLVEDLLSFRAFAALVEAHNENQTPINRFDLYKRAGLGNEEPRPDRLWKNLPTELRDLIDSKVGPGGGISIRLPP